MQKYHISYILLYKSKCSPCDKHVSAALMTDTNYNFQNFGQTLESTQLIMHAYGEVLQCGGVPILTVWRCQCSHGQVTNDTITDTPKKVRDSFLSTYKTDTLVTMNKDVIMLCTGY